ncbi:hypothetical protein N657DRAFT_567194, partial [Parathielavia appendiculata]
DSSSEGIHLSYHHCPFTVARLSQVCLAIAIQGRNNYTYEDNAYYKPSFVEVIDIVIYNTIVTGLARKGLGKLSAKTRDSVDFYLVRYRRTGQGCGGIRRQVSCIVFHSFSFSLSIRDKLVDSSLASCNILLGPLQLYLMFCTRANHSAITFRSSHLASW